MSILTNVVELPDFAAWKEEIAQLKIKYKDPDAKIGMVLYTDGSCRPTSRGTGGWGIHGYIYIERTPTQGHGCKGFTPTVKGHINNVVGDLAAVTVLHYFDGIGTIPGESTNNSAELYALYYALMLIDVMEPTTAIIKPDSEYALHGATRHIDIWRDANWSRPNGGVLANVEIWKAIAPLLETVLNKCALEWQWVKGHKDSIGNSVADTNAAAGALAGLNGKPYSKFIVESTKGYWNPNSTYCKLLAESSWYFITGHKSHLSRGLAFYYSGNHGADNNMYGKPVSTTVYSVVALKTPDPVLEAILDCQSNMARQVSGVNVIGNLSAILKPKVYANIAKHGTDFLYQAPNKLALVDNYGLSLADELDAPRQAYRAMDAILEMESRLKEYIDGDIGKHVRLTDITDLIYEKKEEKKDTINVIRLEQGDVDAVIDVPVTFTNNGSEITRTIPLTVGLDLPKRQTLASIADKEPKVLVVTYPESSEYKAFRYMTIVETNEGYGIWAGFYANLSVEVA